MLEVGCSLGMVVTCCVLEVGCSLNRDGGDMLCVGGAL